jgi:2-polyprenyl-6-methoxyphenol hydroxylase-like FAD-dependent oxidoreductase
MGSSHDYDAVIVGASVGGCAAATLLGRAGLRVVLVEKQPDPAAFKRLCTHYIQASTMPTLERLGLVEPMMAAGAVRSRGRGWTRWGWFLPPADRVVASINLRREKLDPIVRKLAADTPGVDLMLGRTAEELSHGENDAIDGVIVRDRDETKTRLGARLVVGADGRDSRIARLARVPEKTSPHGRFVYGAYFKGPPLPGAPDSVAWFMDPQWALAAPTDGDLVLYGAMLTKDRLPEFKADPEAALVSFMSDMPCPPPVRESERVSPMIAKLDMTNRTRRPTAPGLALIGDAALAADPLYGIGCGWAFRSGEWLAESVAPALHGEEPLERGLRRYRRRHTRELRGHALLINDYATGRRFNLLERTLFSAAAHDPIVAVALDELATRRTKPGRLLARTLPRAIAVNARARVTARRDGAARYAKDRIPLAETP